MKSKFRYFSLLMVILISIFLIMPIVSAKTRQNYLTDFIYSHQVNNDRFGSTYEETAYALEIVNYVVEKNAFKESFEAEIEEMFDLNTVNLYNIYYILFALNGMGLVIDFDLEVKIHTYLNETEQIGGGFSLTNESTSASLTSTYFVINSYSLIEQTIPNQLLHKNWILSCNNSDGGYGGNQTLSSTLTTTYYAVSLIHKLGDLDELENRSMTLEYLTSLYINDPLNGMNYGGYLPDVVSNSALLSSSYYCVEAITMIESNELHRSPTITWVLPHQNFEDGGFSDRTTGTSSRTSSIRSSYFAFKILEHFGALDQLNVEVFQVEFSFMVLIIVLIAIGVVIAIILFIWRRRRI